MQTKIKKSKKPDSMVAGDLMPGIVRQFPEVVAAPATIIFNEVFQHVEWPQQWKLETTVVIPKVRNPSSLNECRNISCTPYLSKLLESIILDDLRTEIPVDPLQYGGMKNCSVDHLLVDLHEEILRPIDHGNPVVIMSVDYEKAFNRLDHGECLKQLQTLGASNTSLSLVRSFLTGRRMQVKVGQTLSNARQLSGGSPQGSILGCELYCLTTQQINPALPSVPPRPEPSGPPSPPTPGGTPPGPDEPSMGLLADWAPSPDASSDDSFVTAPDVDPASPLDSPRRSGIVMVKYVDDTTTVEEVRADHTIKHFTTSRTTERVPASASSAAFDKIERKAADMGMKVNAAKTQVICISPTNGCSTFAEVMAGETWIRSSPSMKLLGYVLGEEPGAAAHVEHLKGKFRAAFWSLINLKRAGIKGRDLFVLYCIFVRPALECNSVIFHPMLKIHQEDGLERLQKMVVRLCYGRYESYTATREAMNISTLKERRARACEKFAAKALANPRFKEKWFVPRDEIDQELRRRQPYVVNRARTLRYQQSPLVNLQKIANNL